MIIDASVWVAAFLTNDANHDASAAVLRLLVQRKRQTAAPVLALPEIAGAIARRTGNNELAVAAVAFLGKQTWLEFVLIDKPLTRGATEIAIEQRLRGADAVYVALAAQTDGVLVTLDREMLKRTPTGVAAYTPAVWLSRA